MGKIAFIFSGQGAQYVGMGKELYDNFAVCREVFQDAAEAIGVSMEQLCFEGPAEELNKTENTQPAVVTVSLAAFEVLKENGITPDVVAGLSLGEYTALTAGGVFDRKTVITLVKKRGRFMQDAVPAGVGAMYAILGMKAEGVKEACREALPMGYVEAANYNCPGQIVIGGEAKAVARAAELAKEKGALKVVPLSVSAPFHTKLLEPAAKRLEAELEAIQINTCDIPLVENITGDYLKEGSDIRDVLKQQVMSPVQWEQSVRRMLEDGVDTFVEIGPGTVLGGFVRKVDRKVTICHVEDMQSLQKTLETLVKV